MGSGEVNVWVWKKWIVTWRMSCTEPPVSIPCLTCRTARLSAGFVMTRHTARLTNLVLCCILASVKPSFNPQKSKRVILTAFAHEICNILVNLLVESQVSQKKFSLVHEHFMLPGFTGSHTVQVFKGHIWQVFCISHIIFVIGTPSFSNYY